MHIHFNLDKVFKFSIYLKALDAALETIGGLLLLIISPDTIERLTNALTQHELSEDPHDFFATLIAHTGHNLAHNSRVFAGVYLLIHGVIKLVVIVCVLKEKLWAYPLLIVVLFAFVCYQVWDLFHKFSWGLTLLTLFDLFIIALTWLEWQKHRHRLHAKEAPA